jgi:hypothetical protein
VCESSDFIVIGGEDAAHLPRTDVAKGSFKKKRKLNLPAVSGLPG